MKNLFKRTPEETNEVKEKIHKRCGQFGYNPFTYYINNSISCVDSSDWLGNVVCNLVYRTEDKSRGKFKYDLDIVGYIVNECFYDSKYDSINKTELSVINDIIETISPEALQQKYKEYVKNKYFKS